MQGIFLSKTEEKLVGSDAFSIHFLGFKTDEKCTGEENKTSDVAGSRPIVTLFALNIK